MKGLSTNTKTIATLFLFVCLAANSQIFQSNFNSQEGSATLALSAEIETSSTLPSNAKNCVLKPNTDTTAKEFRVNENDIVDNDILRTKINNDDSDMSARDKREAARKRRASEKGRTSSNKKITFKLNYKTYVCETGNGSSVTKFEYELKNVDTPEGSIKCPGDCKVGVSQTDAFKDIASKILNSGIKEDINLKYEIAKEKINNKKRAENCEGEFDEYSDGTYDFFEYQNDNEDDNELYRECLVDRIKDLNRSRRNRNKNKSEINEMFELLEAELTDLAQSENQKDRTAALKVIRQLENKSGLPTTMKATLKNIKQYAVGSLIADGVGNHFDKQIKTLSDQSCSVKGSQPCVDDSLIQARINILKTQRNMQLTSEEHRALNYGWQVAQGEGGDESYTTWRTNLSNYFDQTMKQINGIYTGPSDIHTKLGDDTPSSKDYTKRYRYLTENNKYNDIRHNLRQGTSSLGKDIGGVPDELRR